MSWNIWTYLFVCGLGVGIGVELYLAHRHTRQIRSCRNQVPDLFKTQITLAEHQKAADYTCVKTRHAAYAQLWDSALILCWTLGGGIVLLEKVWGTVEISPFFAGVVVLLSYLVISSLLELPLSFYRAFVLEERFSFNRMTKKTFFADSAKKLLLALLVGSPFVLLILWLMKSGGAYWFFYAWGAWLGFSLFMLWAYPAFIAPLFNRFKPLESGKLRDRIEQLLARTGFTSRGIFVMDGSMRSAHGNAYFTGLGKNKRIVFFDTLLAQLNADEIEAVLAHELGHFKRRHIIKRFALMSSMSLVAILLLGLVIDQEWFYHGLGVPSVSPHAALLLFMLAAPVFLGFLQPAFSWLARVHEFEADAFAAEKTKPEYLTSALVKLYRENANTLTPDLLYSAFHDSHPPAPIRIGRLLSQN